MRQFYPDVMLGAFSMSEFRFDVNGAPRNESALAQDYLITWPPKAKRFRGKKNGYKGVPKNGEMEKYGPPKNTRYFLFSNNISLFFTMFNPLPPTQ